MNYTDIPHQTEERKNKPSRFTKSAFEVFEAFIRAVIIVFLILTFCFKICSVVGSSMNNTLIEGERLLVQSIAYTPNEGDIIVFHQTGTLNEPVVKRVIATGNKWVRIDYDNKLLYVSSDETFDDSEIVDESLYRYLNTGSYNAKGVYTVFVPEGFLFVLGDNRNGSLDSRFSAIGLVDERRVLGKVILRFSPFDKFGTVN